MVTTKHTNLLIIQFIYIVFYYIRLFATRVKKKKRVLTSVIRVFTSVIRVFTLVMHVFTLVIHTYVRVIENKKDAYEKTIFEFK